MTADFLDAAGVRRLYDRFAPLYDVAMAPFRAVGAYRFTDLAVAELRLDPGDTVVDLGTGTGRNLVPLARAVAPTGRVIGVDLSAKMLDRARRRVAAAGLQGVELVQDDISTYRLPPATSGVMASYAMEMVAGHAADHRYREMLFGTVYLASGTAPGS